MKPTIITFIIATLMGIKNNVATTCFLIAAAATSMKVSAEFGGWGGIMAMAFMTGVIFAVRNADL